MNKNLTVTMRTAFVLACAAPAAARADGPALRENGNSAAIVWQGDKIAELQGYRRLRFRSNGDNERWIGTRVSKMDLCWDYQGVNDYVLVGKTFQSTETGFVLEIEAEKPSVHGRVRTRLQGDLVSPETGFKYTLSSTLTASQKEWREKSGRGRSRTPGEALPLEILDFHINRVSQADLFIPGATPGMTEMYDGFVISPDGEDWRFIPKIPLTGATRSDRGDNYPTTEWSGEGLGRPGQQLGLVDRREGGWDVKLLEATSPMRISMCWMYFDLHHIFTEGVPPWTAGKDTFEAHYALAFTPLAPARARELLDRAKPVEWRSLPEYQLPVFTRYSTFDRLLSRNSENPWFASNDKCAVDQKVGYDDHASARIQNDDPNDKSAWFAWTWGPCFDSHAPLEGTYRFSAMIKTRDCTAPVRLAVVEFLHDLWPTADGSLVSPKHGMWLVVADQRDRWYYSPQAVSGTTDWTRVTLDLPINNDPFKPNRPEGVRRGVVLQYHGKGTVWFDNVRIEKIE